MIIFNRVIRTAKSIAKKISQKPQTELQKRQYNYLLGIYDSRLFGLCIYKIRNDI